MIKTLEKLTACGFSDLPISQNSQIMQPRPYQQTCIDSALKSFEQFNRALLVLPTGGGKTCVFSWLAQHYQPRKTLILAHRDELIDQAIEKLHRATGIFAQKEKAEFNASLNASVVVASVQTMQRRLGKWPQDHFSLVVADEGHHAISTSWQTVLNHFTGAKVLGVTATPDRGDKRNLGEFFETVAAEISLFDLINQGFLSRISVKSIPLQIDLAKVNQTAGDYDANALGDALAPYLRSIARAIREHASFRRTLVFLPLIATSKAFTDVCIQEGLSAAHVDGYSPDRKEILAAFAAGRFDVLCNAMLLTEGFDDPGIDCVVILRPTRSRSLYSQMVGRGTRIELGKENLLLLDFLWMHEKHALMRPAHLVAKSDEEAEVITKLSGEKAGGGQGELDLECLANEATEARHEKLRRELEENRKKKSKFIDAAEFCLQMGDFEAAEYEPTMQWESKPVTGDQLKHLKRAKIDPDSVRGRGHAQKILHMIWRGQKLKLASSGQREIMRRRGCENWETATAYEARQFFANLRKPKEQAA